MEYNLELDKICREINKRKAKTVLIQLPEGLKQLSKQMIDEIKKSTNAEVILSGDKCFGACDIKTGYDLTVHFGHTKMLNDKNVIYVNCEYKEDYNNLLKKMQSVCNKQSLLRPSENCCSPQVKHKKIGLITTAQHMKSLQKVKKVISKQFTVIIGKHGKRTMFDGQILGCDVDSALNIQDKVDCFLFIGSGEFHPKGVALSTEKPVYQLNPYTKELKQITAEDWEKQKWLRIGLTESKQDFGIVISRKPGQKMHDINKIKKQLKEKGKNYYLIEIDEVTPEKLDYLPFDAFVITACPRIVLDDWRNYKKLILLPDEIYKI